MCVGVRQLMRSLSGMAKSTENVLLSTARTDDDASSSEKSSTLQLQLSTTVPDDVMRCSGLDEEYPIVEELQQASVPPRLEVRRSRG